MLRSSSGPIVHSRPRQPHLSFNAIGSPRLVPRAPTSHELIAGEFHSTRTQLTVRPE